MQRLICIICTALLLVFGSFGETQAAKGGWIKILSKYIDDIGNLGKKAKNISPGQVEAVMKRMPSLAGKSRDVARGVIVIEKTVEKSTAAARLIEGGVNPARVAIAAEKYPQRVKLGNEIAERLAKARPAGNPGNLPAKAAAAASELEGNYTKAGNAFFEMAKRGGRKAVELAERLYEAATPGKVGAAVAAGLLAWHICDPEGAEAAVKSFFKDHMAPMVQAPLEGMLEGGGEVVDSVVSSAGTQIKKIVSNNWLWLLLIFIGLAIWKIPNIIRWPLTKINNFFGNLADKARYASSDKGQSANRSGSKRSQSNNPKPKRVNIYGKQ